MRITPNATAYNALYNIQQNRSKLDSLQEHVASGLNVNRPSDDPVATSLLLSANDRLRASEQYSSNIAKTNIWLNITKTALDGIADTMAQARKLVASIPNGSSDPTITQNVLSQLTSLREQFADMGNTQLQGQYIFSGAKTTTPPFNRSVGTSTYSGDGTVNNIAIDASSVEKQNITGDQLLVAGAPGVNILKTMDDLIAAVQGNNVAGIQTGVQDLQTGAQQITNLQTDVATRLVRLDAVSKLQSNTKNTLETIIGNTQNADYAKLATELSLQQTAFNASLSATAKISQMSLLDFI